ncbi:MAG: hypothetical protein ABSF50_14155 [Burkholderiaceae bacterium]|jgi:hypothetical protein
MTRLLSGHKAGFLIVCALFANLANAHSASDSYLSLEVEKIPYSQRPNAIRGQWDIALRDLDFVLRIDDDGDGKITWKELQRHEKAIEKYAFAHLDARSDAGACTFHPKRQMVIDHADGAYAALFFDLNCVGEPHHIWLNYHLFFAVDPSHRAILIMRSAGDTATALLSPENSRLEFKP